MSRHTSRDALAFALLLSLSTPALAQDGETLWNDTSLHSLPPTAIEYAALADNGSWAFGYRFDIQSFDGLRDGRDDESRSDLVANGYSVFADEMTWQTHTFDMLYGIDGACSLFVSLPFLDKELDGDVAGGGSVDSDSSGIGDVRVGIIRTFREKEDEVLRAHIGLNLPTGSYDEDDGGSTLPYVMQQGTGTFDIHPGVTWMNQREEWTWGLQGRGRFHVSQNDDDWAVSNSFTFNAWASRQLSTSLVGSLRLQNRSWGDYHGGNDDFDALLDQDPLLDDQRQGGMRTDLAAGLAWEVGADPNRWNRIEAEIAVPVDEWLDGPQLSTEFLFTLSWRFSL